MAKPFDRFDKEMLDEKMTPLKAQIEQDFAALAGSAS